MKQFFLLAATAAFILTSCAKIDNVQTVTEKGTPVAFGVYVPKMTKAGRTGMTTTTTIQDTEANGGGFGVFAYYTNDADYTSGSYYANFMYNQKVLYDTDHWTYEPVKYWPNEFGSTAASTGTDKLTFLAYAPYVSSTSGTEGIIGMVANTSAAGKQDAYVTYKLSDDPTKVVDLVWAVDASGLPHLDLTKQATDGKVSFIFKHALARLNVNVRGIFDEVRDAEGDISAADVDSHTKITIESVKITGTLIPQADLNLKNTTANVALWQNPSTAASKDLIIKNSDIAASLKANSGGESSFPGSSVTGVTKTNVNIYTGAAPSSTDSKYFTLIPQSGDQTLTVEIVYYVTTEDDNLAGGISCIKNDITKSVTITGGFVNQKIYNINMALGMTTVKLEASVADWDTTPVEKDVDLPQNL